MRTIGVVTVARSDYGIYLPVLRQINESPELTLHLIVSGMHMLSEYGRTVEQIVADKFEIGDRFEMLLSSDTPEGIAKSIGLGVIGFSQSYSRFCPDILVVLGDRFEMLSAVLAALPFNIPVAHIHGGEVTQGAIDEAIRHSITKMSHLHFVSTEQYKKRVIQMGEEPWRVTVSGAPSLDNLRTILLLDKDDLEKTIGMVLEPAPLLVTFHPVTLEYNDTSWHINELLAALDEIKMPVLFTSPNADTSNRVIVDAISQYVQAHRNARLVTNLGTQAYFSCMKYAAAMVGNSSSGIIEAASFGLPVVNIGSRQRGRIQGRNTIDVDYGRQDIAEAIRLAVSSHFRDSLAGMRNPYGDCRSAERIVQAISEVSIDQKLLHKVFHDHMENEL